MGPGKRDLGNLKFGPISHIIATRENMKNQVRATLVPPIFAKRPSSAIYFSVRILQIGPELVTQ